MEAEGGGTAPYAAAVELTAEPKPDRVNPEPPGAPARWLKPLECYDRRESSEVHGSRYG
jgi:hypothetical protein